MAEHENTELPEELMKKIAGGTIPTEMERDILYYVGNLMKAGFGEEDCIRAWSTTWAWNTKTRCASPTLPTTRHLPTPT
ncbi:MAG: hypothetical protein IJ781_05165 [Atopobiaceae bacterium]|nr:hypothetical protein [Atopobiaceae bacterium]